MEYRTAQRTEHKLNSQVFDEISVNERLEALLNLNAQYDRKAAELDEELDATTMLFALNRKETFAFFGAMLGSIPPVSFFLLLIVKDGNHQPPPLLLVLMLGTVIIASLTGYHSGKLVASALRQAEGMAFWTRLPYFALIGLLWGIVSGAAGGVLIFLIGAIFGAFLGGVVGAVALPLFSIPYMAVKRGELIELKHFLPISIGITLSISAYILGSLYR